MSVGSERLLTLLVGGILVGLVASTMIMFLSSGAGYYGLADDVDDSDMQKLSNLSKDVSSTTVETGEQQQDLEADPDSRQDIEGSIFSQAISAARNILGVGSMFLSMVGIALTSLPLGSLGSAVYTALAGIIMAVIIVGVFFVLYFKV